VEENGRRFDVCIVGAGPSGATCAFYLARAGKSVLLLEKRRFPRDKICGDAVCYGAHRYLEEMGVMRELEDEKLGHWAELGGLVAPSGAGFIGNSVHYSGTRLVVAVKRRILDERMARAAQRAGADLLEHVDFQGASLDRAAGEWRIQARREQVAVAFRASALVAADGAHSHVLQTLGFPVPPSDGICSRAYVKAGTHQMDADGVAFYTDELIPGYAALFKEADGDVNFCTYIIPGGKAKTEDLRDLHEGLLRNHPYICRALGPKAEISKMQGAPLRLGGQVKSFHERLLVVGDAAGHIDPLTGEGIHTAIEGGALAAEELAGALTAGDLSEGRLSRYEQRWMKSFGNDFRWSTRMARIYARVPLFVEASARVMQRQGARALYEWGRMMTGAAPKTGFLRPRVFLPILAEAARGAFRKGPVSQVQLTVGGETRPWQAERLASGGFPGEPEMAGRKDAQPAPLHQ
jgi:geranylgeranyl reductase family protein